MPRPLDQLLQDLRFATRTLAKNPGFTAIAVLTLALGIGANTAIFALFDLVLLKPLPVPEPGRLVLFSEHFGEGTSTGDAPEGRWTLFSFEIFEFLRHQPLPYDALAAVRSGQATVSARLPGASGATTVKTARAHLVSANYFEAMGVRAALGRTLGPGDERADAPAVAVVSDGFFAQRLGRDPNAIGRVAILNGTAVTIVGVAPREFFGERIRRAPDFWMPLRFQPQIEQRPSYVTRSDAFWLTLVGRLAPGATRAQAQVATTTALQQFLRSQEASGVTPERERGIQASHVELVDGAGGISGLRQVYATPLRVLLVVVALVLLIACANVGNLLLSRAAARRAEIAVRVALGASRGRLTRQLLTESLMLAALGAASGIVLARWLADVLIAVVARATPVRPQLDTPVLLFTAAVTVIAGLLFGLAPAFQAWRVDLVTSLKAGSRSVISRRRGLRAAEALVAAQIAVSLVLLVGAGLFARSLLNLQRQSLGFDRDHVLIARINPRLAGYTPATVEPLYRRLYERLRALPGVRSATLARHSPLGGGRSVSASMVEGYSPPQGDGLSLERVIVGPSYPETLGMRLVRGRSITVEDTRASQKVGMVNQTFVRRFFSDRDPIGRHFGVDGSDGGTPVEIVGVLEDVQFQSTREAAVPVVFTALWQEESQFALDCELELRTVGEPGAAVNALRAAIAEVDASLTMDATTLRQQVDATFGSDRLTAQFVSAFGALALLLACVGLYGVVAQAVVRRTNEIGLRLALGARPTDVRWMILRDTLALVSIGLIVGIPAAYGAGRLVSSQLFGLNAGDPWSFGLAAVVMTGVAVMAALLPARRAARIDPMVALRSE